jgi:hypothetical protein
MTLLDIILSLVIWILQKMIIPILPVNLPMLSFSSFSNTLAGLEHNLIWAFAGISSIFDLGLLFTVLQIMIYAEIMLWTIRVILFIIRLVRG